MSKLLCTMSKMKPVMTIVLTYVLVLVNLHVLAAANPDRVLLEDVKVLTLHQGQMTKARRSSPVPQLKCVGGSAGCSAFKPQVVQCYNRGSDGYDVQWECKTDMDNKYRFGRLEVSCEGYGYPDDPYVLRGSCGLEYNLDLTEEGHERKNEGYRQAGYQSNYQDDSYHYRGDHSGYGQKASSVFSDLFKLAMVAFVVYMLYRCCIAGPQGRGDDPPPSYEDTFRGQHQQGPPHGGPSAPPPPYGFRQDYMPGQGGSCSSGAGYSSSQNTTSPPGGNTGGGFWSGAFTGGILGYLMGNRNTGYYGHQRPYTGGWGRNHWGTGWGNSFGTGWGSSWGGGARTSYSSGNRSGGAFSGGSSSRNSSSGTRTASGFGGTTRR